MRSTDELNENDHTWRVHLFIWIANHAIKHAAAAASNVADEHRRAEIKHQLSDAADTLDDTCLAYIDDAHDSRTRSAIACAVVCRDFIKDVGSRILAPAWPSHFERSSA